MRQPGDAAGRHERGPDVLLVVDPVDGVELLGEGGAGDAGDEEVGARGAPEELRLGQSLGERGRHGGGGARRPAVQVGVVRRFGEHVQHGAEFGQRRGREEQPLVGQAGDVDGQAHVPILSPAAARSGVD